MSDKASKMSTRERGMDVEMRRLVAIGRLGKKEKKERERLMDLADCALLATLLCCGVCVCVFLGAVLAGTL